MSPTPTPGEASPSETGPAHPAVARVRATLHALGAERAAAQVRVLDGQARTARAAAEQIGCAVGAIANSLVLVADGEPVLVLTSGAHRLDTTQVAALLGASSVALADPATVRAVTGTAIGGVAPVGHPAPLRTLVDVDLQRHATVWAAAGHPHAVFPTTYDELLRITGGTPAEVGG